MLTVKPVSCVFLTASGYWLEDVQNQECHTLNVFDSGVESVNGAPLQWSLSVGDLSITSGTVSGSSVAKDYGLNGRFDDVLASCGKSQKDGICEELDFVGPNTENLLDQKFGTVGTFSKTYRSICGSKFTKEEQAHFEYEISGWIPWSYDFYKWEVYLKNFKQLGAVIASFDIEVNAALGNHGFIIFYVFAETADLAIVST